MSIVYLDNNATTMMNDKILASMLHWCNKGNPSSDFGNAASEMIYEFKEYIAKVCKFNLPDTRLTDNDYAVIFTSGASESNATIIRMVVDAYLETKKKIPHIVMSSIEHKSIYDMVKSLEERNLVTVTLISPTSAGIVRPEDVLVSIRPDTCLVTIMHANNETGAINDIQQIGKLAHSRGVPFHTDTVQTFGRFPIAPIDSNVDSFCISFHKFNGPPGVGALVIKSKFIKGFNLNPIITGSQNDNLRGGTENTPGLGAAFTAMKLCMNSRAIKNKRLSELKEYIVKSLVKEFSSELYSTYNKAGSKLLTVPKKIVFLSDITDNYLPNTIMLSVVKKVGTPVCNVGIKKKLMNKGIIISVGSACNTSSDKASHVLYAMGADEYIRKGALRITLGDYNLESDIQTFIVEFIKIVHSIFK